VEILDLNYSDEKAVKIVPLEVLSYGHTFKVTMGDAGSFYIVRDDNVAALAAMVGDGPEV
jgi:hypothetical protein